MYTKQSNLDLAHLKDDNLEYTCIIHKFNSMSALPESEPYLGFESNFCFSVPYFGH